MDKLIEQAIKNCKINKYEKYFEQVCKEYKCLLEAESKQLNLADVRGSFSAEDMIKAFNAGGDYIYKCEANGKDKKCYCRNNNDCSHRHYISAEEWLKNYR